MRIDFKIEIDGRDVPVRFDNNVAKYYKRYFGRDVQTVMYALAAKPNSEIEFTKKDTIKLAQFIWVLIKNANLKTPGFNKWIKTVKDIPVESIIKTIHKEVIAYETTNRFR